MVPDQHAKFYAIGVTTNPRIVYGTWAAVAPMTMDPTAHGVAPSWPRSSPLVARFKDEASALKHMLAHKALDYPSTC